ncbi:MAG: hypothetical protein R3B40_20165 [Polyangiales bacterium]|nr:hypothetical protein [Myxococcales bacterium]MCB9659356.1 hypothetical protein [Sandaracinaceae bacterium]
MSHPRPTRLARRSRVPSRERGLVMLVVLLVLMMISGVAIFAMHTSSLELRASGHSRRAMQAEYVSEGTAFTAQAAVATMGSETLLHKLRRDRELGVSAGVGGTPEMQGLETDYSTNQFDVGRLTPADFTLLGGVPTTTDQLGPHEPGEAVRWVDVNDVYVTQLNRAGERSGDGAPAVQMHIVYTARARLRPAAGVTSGVETNSSELDYGFHPGESAAATRLFSLQTDYPAGRL